MLYIRNITLFMQKLLYWISERHNEFAQASTEPVQRCDRSKFSKNIENYWKNEVQFFLAYLLALFLGKQLYIYLVIDCIGSVDLKIDIFSCL